MFAVPVLFVMGGGINADVFSASDAAFFGQKK
jgi:hypothetical protein